VRGVAWRWRDDHSNPSPTSFQAASPCFPELSVLRQDHFELNGEPVISGEVSRSRSHGAEGSACKLLLITSASGNPRKGSPAEAEYAARVGLTTKSSAPGLPRHCLVRNPWGSRFKVQQIQPPSSSQRRRLPSNREASFDAGVGTWAGSGLGSAAPIFGSPKLLGFAIPPGYP